MSQNMLTNEAPNQEAFLEEFSIMELEQRLEFEAWCDGNCNDCTGTGTGTGPITVPSPIEIGG
jgi:hypothetical protein